MSEQKVAVVTGGTSGIGRATALALTGAGCTVYELSRRAEGVEGLHHIAADVTREDTVRAAVAEIMAREGRIDILVNNAGFGISGAVEFTDTEDAKALFDVNFFGMVNLNRAVVPLMRQAGRGRIVNLSSVARMEHDEETGMDPARAGAYIARVALREGSRHPLYAIRFDYKFFTFLAKILPARFLNWLIFLLYGR